MKTGVIGSRTFENYNFLKESLKKHEITEIISGGARGADSLAEKYAQENNIKTTIFPAEWDKYGKQAGFIRNRYIVENSDIIIAFWDGLSRGTKHSMGIAKELNKEVIIYYF